MTPQASHRFAFSHKVLGEYNYYIASNLSENFPYDFSVSKLKNDCIKAARILQPDWLILLSGIDASIINLPSFNKLDENILYLGHRLLKCKNKIKCSNWLMSKKIFNKYLLNESFECYGWEDFDFIYNVCFNIKKELRVDFLTEDFREEPIDLKLVNCNEYAKITCEKNKTLFLDRYKLINKQDFDFKKHDSLK